MFSVIVVYAGCGVVLYMIYKCGCLYSRYMGIGLSAQGVNMNRLPGKLSYIDLVHQLLFVTRMTCTF